MDPKCLFIEVKPGTWYYLLAKPLAPDVHDWRQEADAHGSFSSLADAEGHLHYIYPGPVNRILDLHYREGYKPDAILAERMEAALERFKAATREGPSY